MLVEVIPQAAALLLAFPVLAMTRDYTAVVSLSIAQAIASVVLSHVLASTPYRFAADGALLKRQLAFGWPILASALPLIAVYQGDRLIIGSLSGMEALANYTAAFMITMVPGLIAAKVGHAMMLPLFSDAVRRGQPLTRRFQNCIGSNGATRGSLSHRLYRVRRRAAAGCVWRRTTQGLAA